MRSLALRDVMSREFVGVSESDALLDAVELMRTENTGSAVVLRGNNPVGIVTTEAVLDLLVRDGDPKSASVAIAMRQNPPSLAPASPVSEAAELMGRTAGSRILVQDDDGVHGVVEARDLTAAVTERSEQSGDVAASRPSNPETPPSTMAETTDRSEYSAQSICEVCGSLSRELTNVNGQLLCSDCRSV